MADFQAYLSLFLICLLSIFLIQTVFFKSNRAKSRLPPSPFALPIVGHLHLINPNAHQALHKLSLRYGPVFRILLGSVPCVVACTPESAKEILKTNEASCLDRPPNAALDYLTYGSKGFSFGPYGPHWKFMKKIIMSHLLNGPTLDLLYPVRREEINVSIKSLSRNAKLGNAVDVSAELMKISNNIVTRMLLGKRCSDNESDAREVRDFIAEMLESMGKFSLSNYSKFFRTLDLQGFGKKLKDAHQRFNKLIVRIVKEHEEARKQNKTGHQVKDLLYILLDIAEDESMDIKLSRDNIKAFMHEDQARQRIPWWALSELINHPDIMKKAVAEIDQVVGKNRLVQESDIPNLPYLQAVVKETLRLYPAGPLVPRQSTQDCTLAGYHIPANTTIFINLWVIGRDPNYWENPLEFSPERYQGAQFDVRGQNFQLIPFGSGRRMCPGSSLAMHVMHTMLGAMIQCFEWKAGKDGNLLSVDMEEGHGITLPRASPLVCVPLPRLDPIPSSM